MIRWSPGKTLVLSRRFAGLCLVGGVVLLALNLVGGLVVPLRDARIYEQPRNRFIEDTNKVLTAAEFWKKVEPVPGESARDFAVRATYAVEEGTAFLYATAPDFGRYHWLVPVWKNYLLWASRYGLMAWRRVSGGVTDPMRIYAYTFSDPHRALERGVALCGQKSSILMSLLQDRGIPARYLSFSNHAMVEAEVEPGVWWVLDPTARLALPYDMATLRKNPDLIRQVCQSEGQNAASTEFLVNCLSGPPPRVTGTVKETHKVLHYYFEAASYYLIWVIPGGLLAVGLAGVYRRGEDLQEATEEAEMENTVFEEDLCERR